MRLYSELYHMLQWSHELWRSTQVIRLGCIEDLARLVGSGLGLDLKALGLGMKRSHGSLEKFRKEAAGCHNIHQSARSPVEWELRSRPRSVLPKGIPTVLSTQALLGKTHFYKRMWYGWVRMGQERGNKHPDTGSQAHN